MLESLGEADSKRIKLEEFKLPLKNKKGEIAAWTLVDEDDYNKFKHQPFYLSHFGYVKDNKHNLHRLIIDAKKGEIVDHINRNKLDNRKENLRIVTHVENARNKTKLLGASSQYHGVSWINQFKKWRCTVCKGGSLRESYLFDNETHAAYWRDVLVLKYDLKGSILNNLEKPIDFIEPNKQKRKIEVGVQERENGNFRARTTINGKRTALGSFSTYAEAKAAYDSKRTELLKLKEEEIMNREI